MSNTQNIGDIIRQIVEDNEEIYSQVCKVKEVEGDTATLEPVNGDSELFDVKIVAGDTETPLYIEPKVDSVVIATFLSKDTAFISLYSEIESIKLRGDELGGLIKIEDLVDKINRLENKVNDLITKFNSHIHITTATVGATPTPGLLSPTTTPEVAITPTTTVADLENEKVKHG